MPSLENDSNALGANVNNAFCQLVDWIFGGSQYFFCLSNNDVTFKTLLDF
jgi:hypothetical protein